MNVQDVGNYSLGQWLAIVRIWNKAHGAEQVAPPSEDEFETAVMKARGVA